jgi:hypothetical protein
LELGTTSQQRYSLVTQELRDKSSFKLLEASTLLLIGGLGLAHFSGEQPYGALFENADKVALFIGIALLMSFTLLTLFPRKYIKQFKLHYVLIVVTLLSLLGSICSFINAGYVPEQLIEYAIKVFLPISLFVSFEKRSFSKKNIFFLKVLVALTFIGHGTFALGLNYVPGGFVSMTTTILGLSVDQAFIFLKIAGALDFIFAALMFVNSKMLRYSAIYLVSWGLITAFARLAYGLSIPTNIETVTYYAANTVYRIPHGLIPLLLVVLDKQEK